MASNDKMPSAKNEQPLSYRVVDALLRRGLRLIAHMGMDREPRIVVGIPIPPAADCGAATFRRGDSGRPHGLPAVDDLLFWSVSRTALSI